MTWRLLRPIWRLENITASQRLVLLALASFTDQRGENAYPSQSTLARMCCCSRSTVKRALAVLIARKLIIATGTAGKGTIKYAVTMNHVQAHHAPSARPTVGYNPSNNNPGYYPGERDSDSYSSSPGLSGDSSVRRYRRTRKELSEEHARKRAAGQALIAGNHRP